MDIERDIEGAFTSEGRSEKEENEQRRKESKIQARKENKTKSKSNDKKANVQHQRLASQVRPSDVRTKHFVVLRLDDPER